MNYYQHHIGDFRSATRHLSLIERQIYLELMWTYYDKEVPIPDEINKVARRLGADPRSVKEILEDFFILRADGWHHERCDDELAKYHARIMAASKAGKASAKSRRSNGRSTVVQRSSTNQEPITSAAQDKPERTGAVAKARPRDLDTVIQYWEEANLQGDPNVFWDHFESNGWKVGGKAPMKDWKASARNFSRREEKREADRRAHRTESHHGEVMRKLSERIKAGD